MNNTNLSVGVNIASGYARRRTATMFREASFHSMLLLELFVNPVLA